MSVAYITPQTLPWVYEEAEKVRVLVEGTNGTVEEKTLPFYSFEFNWRGELFLTLGMAA